MRILQVIEFVTPAKGGSVQVARATAAGLAQRGHQVELWSSNYGQLVPIKNVQLKRFRGPYLSGLCLTPGILFAAIKRLGEFDLIHFHDVRTIQNLAVGLQAIAKKVPYIITPHGTLTTNGQKVKLKQIYDALLGTKQFLRRAARITAVSELEREDMIRFGINPSCISLICNPVETTSATLNPSNERFDKIIGYLGRLEQSKGIDKLILAFAFAQSQNEEIRLEIVGPDDGDLYRLQRIVAKLGLDSKVVFRGPLYGQEKHEFLARCSVVANPRSFEIFGLSTFEAIAQGTPVVVAQDSGGASLVAQSGIGVLVDTNDPVTFGLALLKQINLPASVRTRGQAFVRKHLSVEQYLDQIELLYAQTLQSSRHKLTLAEGR